MNIKINTVRNARGAYGNVLFADITVGKYSYGFSRYADEKVWSCDSQFFDWRPIFVHGIGSRCCIKLVATGELEAALNATLQLALR